MTTKTFSWIMDKMIKGVFSALLVGLICLSVPLPLSAQSALDSGGLDARVSRFLEEARLSWSDWNIPYEDGKILYNLVLQGRFRNILEIGTSTGHSTIWLALAASKTGGKVTTIEIDRGGTRRPRPISGRPVWPQSSTPAWATPTTWFPCSRGPLFCLL